VPIPVETEEEFQTLAAELSRRLEQSKPRRMKAVQHEGTNHPVAKAAFFIAGVHLQPN
jgi:hypothetical protein